MQHFNSWIIYESRLLFADEPLINRGSYRLILSNASDFLPTFSVAQVFSRELLLVNGYTRANPTWITGSLSGRTYTFDQVEVSFTPTGSLTYRTGILVADARATPGVAISGIAANVITTGTAHGLTDDDAIMLRTDGTQPGGTSGTTIYYADVLSATTLSLLDAPGGSVVPITTAGTGNLQITFAAGRPVWFNTEPTAITIPANNQGKYRIIIQRQGQ